MNKKTFTNMFLVCFDIPSDEFYNTVRNAILKAIIHLNYCYKPQGEEAVSDIDLSNVALAGEFMVQKSVYKIMDYGKLTLEIINSNFSTAMEGYNISLFVVSCPTLLFSNSLGKRFGE